MLESRGLALSSELVEQSIRNQLPGTIKSIASDKVLSEVIVETGIGKVASVINVICRLTSPPWPPRFSLVLPSENSSTYPHLSASAVEVKRR
jgi:hypothetical protein